MNFDQATALVVLAGVVAGLIWGRIRSDVVALAGAAALLGLGVIRPSEVQGAFASPAILALASLFVIAYALELSGLLGAIIRAAVKLCAAFGEAGLWAVIAGVGAASAFLNNTPLVVLGGPVVRDMARSMKLSPRRFLIPLTYATSLGGACTLIGSSTNLLVNDMARNAGQPTFGMFEVTPPALISAGVGALYLFLAGGRIAGAADGGGPAVEPGRIGAALPEPAELFAVDAPFNARKAFTALAVFIAVIAAAAMGYAPIAAAAFTGAVVLVLLGVIDADEAYRGLRPEILLLIIGMLVVGLAVQVTGLADKATGLLVAGIAGLSPAMALAILYGATLVVTEFLSHAAVAVLMTPVAVALADTLGVNPRPFIVGVMLAASSAFATPFAYQTNVIAFRMGRYRYLDFVRTGLPLDLLTAAAAIVSIPRFFPF
jgi:di/tricarboxylate transporter